MSSGVSIHHVAGGGVSALLTPIDEPATRQIVEHARRSKPQFILVL
jgi:hypothetical protein